MNKPLFLLVHGSWHGPWCWIGLQSVLFERGFESHAVSLPSVGSDRHALKDFAADAAVVTAAAKRDREIVVVGHSYGGAVIGKASFGANVPKLIFIGAFMPDSGRGYVSYLPPGPLPPYVKLEEDGTFMITPGTEINCFYHDCVPEVAAWAAKQVRPQSQSVLQSAITKASWRSKSSTFILTTQDRVLPPEMLRQFAGQATNSVEIDSSHSPMLSKPSQLAELMISAAAT